MRLASMHFKGYKRFTDTQIVGLPSAAKLVVLAGPNGSGKSSIFEGLRTWHMAHGAPQGGWDESYGHKMGSPPIPWHQHVEVTFHEPIPAGGEEQKKLVYTRSAFRNEPDFNITTFNSLASPLDNARGRMIDNDQSVSENYQRLIMQTIDGIYLDELPDTMTKAEIRDRIIGDARAAMEQVFPDLVITGVGGVGSSAANSQGTFYFDKGDSERFLYKNLSAGEKAAFDLVLDTVIKRDFYDDTIWCIDEPETHLNTRVQAVLLQTLLDLLPDACQLVVASHSIGFMRKAWELAQVTPESVCFIDLQDKNFDEPIVIQPVRPTRDFWARTLDVALGDLARLVAPDVLVLCEGRPTSGSDDGKAEFDARCYRQIFATEFPNTDFLSVGNSADVTSDRLEIGRAFQTIASGTTVLRVRDRDMSTEVEVSQLPPGVRVLNRRHLESYLFDDEVLEALCHAVGKPDKIDEALAAKADALAQNQARGKDVDDVKSASGLIYNGLRRALQLTSAGSDGVSFARDTLAPLLQPGMSSYGELRDAVFGDLT